MDENSILLRNKNDIVGFGMFVIDQKTQALKEEIHGHALSQFAKKGERLVAVYGVQIFQEFEAQRYPYVYKGLEDPPVLLGDLNNVEKAFQHIIAWDKNRTTKNPRPSIAKLQISPRTISADLLIPILPQLHRTPPKIRFRRNELISSRPRWDWKIGGIRNSENDSPVDEPGDLFVKEISVNASNSIHSNERSEESAQCEIEWEKNMEEGILDPAGRTNLRSTPQRLEENGSDEIQPNKKSSNQDLIQQMAYLSPTERIVKNMREVRRNANGTGQRSVPQMFCLSPAERIMKKKDRKRKTARELNVSLTLDGEESGDVRQRPSLFFSPLGGAQSAMTNNVNAPVSGKKRLYRFKMRKEASTKQEGNLRRKRMALWKHSFEENPFMSPRECCNAGCFFLVNPQYAVVQYRKFLLMNRVERKRALKTMYIRDANAFWFDGEYVCSRFLVKGLSFSNQLQSAVKGTPKARASSSVAACPRECLQETKRNMIIVYLRDIAARIGDSLPTKRQQNLPLMNKKKVMERLKKYAVDMGGREVPSLGYFYSIWKKFCSDIKTHRHHGFTVCDTCERIRVGFEMAENENIEAILRKELESHHQFVEAERRGYEHRRDLAIRNPGRYLSMIVDGADQKSYGLPHFVFHTKEDKGEKLKVKIVGVLEHGTEKQLSLFTLTEEFESGANHIIEALHRVLNSTKVKRRKLPPVLFLQADNCTRENKNRFLLSYLDMLVSKGVFQEVHLSFLPIGHTHADIDQAFSSVATRFKMERAITDEDMLELLRKCYNPMAFAEAMDNVANFSGLCRISGCVRNVEGFSHYRFFRFTRRAESGFRNHESDEYFRTTCDVKVQATEEWSPFDNTSNREAFLKFVPNLNDVPVTDTTPPDNVLEINKHIRSCERRIQSVQKLRRLEDLRDRIYTRRLQRFHWDLQTSFEEHGDYKIIEAGEEEMDEICIESHVERDEEQYIEKLRYSLNYFIAVKTSSDCEDLFWIARILQVADIDEEGNTRRLKVRWYQAMDAGDAFSSTYLMSTYNNNGERELFDDTVDVRSVLCEFESLTRRGGLHVRTQKAIRQTLNLH